MAGKFSGDDLLLPHATLEDVDGMADIAGFGDAMYAVEWAIETPQGVVFPGFAENNVPADSAERQRAYRERKRDAALHSSRNASNGTEQSRAEQTRGEETTAGEVAASLKGMKFTDEEISHWVNGHAEAAMALILEMRTRKKKIENPRAYFVAEMKRRLK